MERLGVVLTTTGDYETADTCYVNALTLAPGTPAYQRNRDKNRVKWQANDVLEVEDDAGVKVPKNPIKSHKKPVNSDIGLLKVVIFFVPFICWAGNIGIGVLALMACSFYVYLDAKSIGAGKNPNGTSWSRTQPWLWALACFCIWFLYPLYLYKRREIVEENFNYIDKNPAKSDYTVGKIVVGIIGFLFLCVIVSAFVYGFSGGYHSNEAVTTVTTPTYHTTTVQTNMPVYQATVVQTYSPPTDTATLGERNAAKKALDYLKFMHFSRDGLIKQLEYEGFSHSEAEYGVDKSGVNWNEQAAGKAKDYLKSMSFSRDGLIKQLEYEGFTSQQAEYGVKTVGY